MIFLKVISLFFLISEFCVNVYSAGLSTHLAEVTVNNLEPGKKYSLKQTTNMSLKVFNTGTDSVNLKIDVLIPQSGDLKPGYEPLPDINWIKIEKDYFENIAPNNFADTDVIISIPDSYLYLGKKYQAYLWSHTVANQGGFGIGVGLNSRLLIGITDYKISNTGKQEKKLNFKLKPDKLNIKTKVGEKTETKIKIENISKEKQRYVFRLASEEEIKNNKNKEDFIKDNKWITFGENDFEVEPGEIKEMNINVLIPENNHKKLFALIRIDCSSEHSREGIFYPVYIKVK